MNTTERAPIETYAGVELTLSAEDVARILGVGKRRAQQIMQDAPFPVIRIGRRLRCRASALNAWLDSLTYQQATRDDALSFDVDAWLADGDAHHASAPG